MSHGAERGGERQALKGLGYQQGEWHSEKSRQGS